MSSSNRRVVITGMGLISPLGNSPEELWESVSQRRSGIDLLTRLPGSELPSDIGGEARGFTGDISDFGELEKQTKRAIKKGIKLMCREIQLGVAAAQLAIGDSGLDLNSVDSSRIGTMFGCDYIVTEPSEFAAGVKNCMDSERQFRFEDWGEHGRSGVVPLWLLKYLPNMPASHVAIYNDLRGPSNSITLREAAGNLAIAEAVTTIRRGVAEQMVAGATGCRIQPLRTLYISLQEKLADRNAPPANGDAAAACRPYEKSRTGSVLGEGAGVLMLEELGTAEARGATIYGEVLGYGSSAVANDDGVADYRQATINALRGALETAQLSPEEIGYVNGHGCGSLRSDREEACGIRDVMGDDFPVTSVKSWMGNLGAGSAVVELIASLTAAQRANQMVPTLNHQEADPECPIQVITEPMEHGSSPFINFNMTPQGQSSALVIRKWG